MWSARWPLTWCGFRSKAKHWALKNDSARRWVAAAPDEFGPDHGRFLAEPQVGRRWGMADGCAFDAVGNLWVTLVLANRIVAIGPEGRATVVLDDPDGALLSGPTSIAWGGQDMRDVYIGSILTPYVLKGRSSVPGMPMVHQRRSR